MPYKLEPAGTDVADVIVQRLHRGFEGVNARSFLPGFQLASARKHAEPPGDLLHVGHGDVLGELHLHRQPILFAVLREVGDARADGLRKRRPCVDDGRQVGVDCAGIGRKCAGFCAASPQVSCAARRKSVSVTIR